MMYTLTRFSFWADLYIFSFLVILLGGVVYVAHGSWILAFSALIAWTAIEYFGHRYILHRLPLFSAPHKAHHLEPQSLIGIPYWLSLVISVVILAGLGIFTAWPNALSIELGLLVGYLWYISVHAIIHHKLGRLSRYWKMVRRHHSIHHYRSETSNFGVTTPVWDYVFRTFKKS